MISTIMDDMVKITARLTNIASTIDQDEIAMLVLTFVWLQNTVTIDYPWRRMMTSSNGNIFGVTGPLCGEFTGPRWIPSTKASDAELWCFRLSK